MFGVLYLFKNYLYINPFTANFKKKTHFLPLKWFFERYVAKFHLSLLQKHFFTITLDFEPDSVVQYLDLTNVHNPKFGLFLADSFPIFSCFFSFPFSLPFFSLYLLPFIPFQSTGKVLASALQKT